MSLFSIEGECELARCDHVVAKDDMTRMLTGISRLPPKDTPSGWVPINELHAIGRPPLFERVSSFDWAVVGAGFTGLAAARRLAELHPDQSVALIDAMPIGWGASGRNSGFIIDLPHKFDIDHDDADRLRAILRLNGAAIADLRQHVEAYGIECEWSPAGKLQGAIHTRGTGKLRSFIQALERISQPYELLEREAVAQITGTAYYAGAVRTPGCVLMNPVKLTRGLARSMPENVRVMDGCPVERFAPESRRVSLTLRSQGALMNVSAIKVLLCTNAFTPEFGHLRHRIVPLMTFASMTRPLTDSEMEVFGGQLDWGLTPADPGGTTLRMTQDRRLLVRNHFDYAGRYGVPDGDLDRVRAHHRSAFEKRYPKLTRVPFVSTWGGVCGYSRNHVSFFGEVAANIWSSSCHNGVGVARGSISGRLLAEAASGDVSTLLKDMYAVSSTPALNPPDPFLSLGVRMRLKLAAWESRDEV
jgi:glycine/D-amino acid oxidase-like deaminating enzyme